MATAAQRKAQERQQAKTPPPPMLIQHWQLVARKYSDGTYTVDLQQMDISTRRLIVTRLLDGHYSSTSTDDMARLLAEGGREILLDDEDQLSLW